MNVITAIEIFTNPYDLEFRIGPSPGKKHEYFLVVSRGPEHNFKLMLDGSGPPKKEMVELVERILRITLEKGAEIFSEMPRTEADQLVAAIVNPVRVPLNDPRVMNILTEKMVELIIKELMEKEVCSTYTWLKLLCNEEVGEFAIALTEDWNTVLDRATGLEDAMAMVKRNTPRLTAPVAERFLAKVEEFYAVL